MYGVHAILRYTVVCPSVTVKLRTVAKRYILQQKSLNK